MNDAAYERGTMVFWGEDPKPWWVVDWQPDNGRDGAYWLIDADGNSGVASDEELRLIPTLPKGKGIMRPKRRDQP